MNEDILENIYQERLEERIIAHLAAVRQSSLEESMRKYYSSNLANKIYEGRHGIQYLDYKELVQILLETEPDLFSS